MNVIKQQATAQSVAAKKTQKSTDGTVYVIKEVPGGWQVVPEGQTSSEEVGQFLVAADQVPAPAVLHHDEPVPQVDAQVVAHVAAPVEVTAPIVVTGSNDVTVDVPGAYRHLHYVFVPQLGGKFRYFFQNKVKGIEDVEGGLRLTLPARDLKRRGLHTMLQEAKKAA